MNKQEYINKLLSMLPDSYTERYNAMYPDPIKGKTLKRAIIQAERSVEILSDRYTSMSVDYHETADQITACHTEISQLKSQLHDAHKRQTMLQNKISDLSEDPASLVTAVASERLRLLDELEAGGVDNWVGWDDAIERMNGGNS